MDGREEILGFVWTGVVGRVIGWARNGKTA